jgi:hypothetical protein
MVWARVAGAQGLAFREYSTFIDTNVHAMAFEAPDCSRPVLVVVLEENLDREAVVDLGGDEGDALHYVFIDRDWEKPDHLGLFLERMKYAALQAFRLTRYVPDIRPIDTTGDSAPRGRHDQK